MMIMGTVDKDVFVIVIRALVFSAHRSEAEEAQEHDAAAGFVQSDEEFHGGPFFECA